MKIRWDFVTNSSSTSFVLVCKGRPTRSEFLAAMGLQPKSALAGICDELFGAMLNSMEPVEESLKSGYYKSRQSVYELIEEEFSKRTAERVTRGMSQGFDVWVGRLSSDGGPGEGFFACESFEIEKGDLYVNALPCTW